MSDANAKIHKSDLVKIQTKKDKDWYGQEVGVNSETPLMDEGSGQNFIVRQFIFSFNPSIIKQIQDKKIPAPTHQELFNSNWPQMRIMLWADGLVAVQENDYPPKIVVGKKKYKIILTCQPRSGVMVNEKVNKLQDVLKPQLLTNKT